MRRIHFIELADQSWFPQLLRDAAMAFLRLGGEHAGHAKAIHGVVRDALARSGEQEILDLCSGGGGQAVSLADELEKAGEAVSLTLTDLYPNDGARALAAASHATVRFVPEPVDARNVSSELPGLRTILNAFHHFRPHDAREILASAVAAEHAIAVVEVARRTPITALAILGTPFHTLLIVPLLRPFRWSWLPLTYLVPVVPITIFWDAFVSCLRTYTTDELLAMAQEADPKDRFEWKAEEPELFGPLRGVSLVGIPRPRTGSRKPARQND